MAATITTESKLLAEVARRVRALHADLRRYDTNLARGAPARALRFNGIQIVDAHRKSLKRVVGRPLAELLELLDQHQAVPEEEAPAA